MEEKQKIENANIFSNYIFKINKKYYLKLLYSIIKPQIIYNISKLLYYPQYIFKLLKLKTILSIYVYI